MQPSRSRFCRVCQTKPPPSGPAASVPVILTPRRRWKSTASHTEPERLARTQVPPQASRCTIWMPNITDLSLYERYELLDLNRDLGVKTFEAREIATGRPVKVHLFEHPSAPLQ